MCPAFLHLPYACRGMGQGIAPVLALGLPVP